MAKKAPSKKAASKKTAAKKAAPKAERKLSAPEAAIQRQANYLKAISKARNP